jgi:hypothetical protein
MENQDNNKSSKVTDSEHYDINHPQNLNIPEYNSTSEKRSADKIPAVENLNHQDGLKDEFDEAEPNDNQDPASKDDKPLFGEGAKTDLGNGDKTDKDDEGLIRV